MAFKKGDRIEASTRGGIVYGFVYKSGADVTMIFDNGVNTIKGKPTLFKESNHPLPDDSPFKSPITKPGTRVRLDNGVEAFIVSADIFQAKARNGDAVYILPQGQFAVSDIVPPVDGPSQMDKWSIRKYRANAAMSEETTAYTAEILLDGKKVIDAKNQGHGGSDMYHGTHALTEQLEADAKNWLSQFGYEETYEATGMWVEWAANMKPYGYTATEYVADYAAVMAGIRAPGR